VDPIEAFTLQLLGLFQRSVGRVLLEGNGSAILHSGHDQLHAVLLIPRRSCSQDAHVPKTLMFLAAPLIAAGRKGKERAGQLKVVGRRGDRLDRRAKPHRRKARYSALR
jgi:hypothetical protein